MRLSRRVLAASAVAVALVAVLGGRAALSSGDAGDDADSVPANTAQVEQGELSAVVSQSGILTYRARPDGSPYPVINHAGGIYTGLPAAGDRIGCGDVLYRVDERPVLLLCGAVPAYRALRSGDAGADVVQLNRTLHERGDDAKAHVSVDPAAPEFTGSTAQALTVLQREQGAPATGALAVGDAVFLPGPVLIAKVSGNLGAPASPGTQVLAVTSDTLQVLVEIDPSQQGQIEAGDPARITLPGGVTVTGKVVGFGRVAQASGEQGEGDASATIPTSISLDDPGKARGLDQAPVQVDVITAGVENALSVPLTALVGRSGGGFAVEVVRDGGRREFVAVTVGLTDSAEGRVQVDGDLRAGDLVVVPSL